MGIEPARIDEVAFGVATLAKSPWWPPDNVMSNSILAMMVACTNIGAAYFELTSTE
jgi:hypothetical protein